MSDTAKAEASGVDQEGAAASPSLINSKNHRPGRELDALIAERVMGERKPRFTHGLLATTRYLAGDPIVSKGGCWMELCTYESGDNPEWVPLHFSTDIGAAWSIVEKMSSGGWFALSTIREGRTGYFANRLQPSSPVRSDAIDHEAEGESMPHAICLAALSAVDA